jgi:hypothetical protein
MLCRKHFHYGRVKQPEKHSVTNCSARVLGILPVKHFIVYIGTVFKPVRFPVTCSFGNFANYTAVPRHNSACPPHPNSSVNDGLFL